VRQVAYERERADREWREADRARVRALLDDPATLRQLRRQWEPRPQLPDGTFPPIPPLPTTEPEPPPHDPNAPPSSGKNISPPRDPNAPPNSGRVISPPRR
jgi:hypothetical protein